ncbi:acyl-coenzyme A thioesterase PaaI, partial [Escherichia coli]
WLILPLPTPAIARGWQPSLLPARLIFCVQALPETP